MNSILSAQFWIDMENWPISWEIGGSWLFPFLESLHVIGATFVLGSIFMVDLRLLGVAANRYAISTLSKELVALDLGGLCVGCGYRSGDVYNPGACLCE